MLCVFPAGFLKWEVKNCSKITINKYMFIGFDKVISVLWIDPLMISSLLLAALSKEVMPVMVVVDM